MEAGMPPCAAKQKKEASVQKLPLRKRREASAAGAPASLL